MGQAGRGGPAVKVQVEFDESIDREEVYAWMQRLPNYWRGHTVVMSGSSEPGTLKVSIGPLE